MFINTIMIPSNKKSPNDEIDDPFSNSIDPVVAPAVVVPVDISSVIYDIGKFSIDNIDEFTNEIKLKNRCVKFEIAFSRILSTIKNIDSNDKLEKVFKLVVQSLEDYIYTPDNAKCNKMKHDLAIKLLNPLVNNEKICNDILNMTLKNIKKTSTWRRCKNTIIRTFFFVLKMLQPAK